MHLCSLGTSVMFLGLCWLAFEMGRTKEGEVSRLAAACTFSSPSGNTWTWSMDSCNSSTHSVLCVGETRNCLTDSCTYNSHSALHLGRLAPGPRKVAHAPHDSVSHLGRQGPQTAAKAFHIQIILSVAPLRGHASLSRHPSA